MKYICVYVEPCEDVLNLQFVGLVKAESDPEEAARRYVGDWIAELAKSDSDVLEGYVGSVGYFYVKPDAARKILEAEISPTLPYYNSIMLTMCKVFEIKKISLEEMLRCLGDADVGKALDLGWKPTAFRDKLSEALQLYEPKDLAEMYYDEIMSDADDIEEVFGWTEMIYAFDAEEFLSDLEELNEREEAKTQSEHKED